MPLIALQQKVTEKVLEKTSEGSGQFMIILSWLGEHWLKVIIGFFAAYYGLKLFIKFIRLLYLHFHSRRLVFLKISLPRTDSKLDQENRTEKGFKEKVAVMAQLFRALYEIRELNLWNMIKTKIWQGDNIFF